MLICLGHCAKFCTACHGVGPGCLWTQLLSWWINGIKPVSPLGAARRPYKSRRNRVPPAAHTHAARCRSLSRCATRARVAAMAAPVLPAPNPVPPPSFRPSAPAAQGHWARGGSVPVPRTRNQAAKSPFTGGSWILL
jgi:hypothetical protein